MSTVDTDFYFTIDDLASRYRVSRRTVENWRYERKGPRGIRIRGRVLFHIDEVRAWEDLQREQELLNDLPPME